MQKVKGKRGEESKEDAQCTPLIFGTDREQLVSEATPRNRLSFRQSMQLD